MNSFANSLFSLLFGWAKTLIQQIWTAVLSGNFSGFFTWLGDHWLWVALFLGVVCTAVDFLIWMVRWRPYLVWRTKLRAFRRWITGEERRSAKRFEEGYNTGVGLDMAADHQQRAEEPLPDPGWMDPGDADAWWQQPMEAEPAPVFAPVWNAPVQEEPVFAAASVLSGGAGSGISADAPWGQASTGGYVLNAEAPFGEMAEVQVSQGFGGAFPPDASDEEDDAARRRMFVPASDYELPPVAPSTRVRSSFGTDMPAARRKRRSEKYEKRKSAWRQKLIRDDEEEDRLLDGLPPAVDREQAFYEPVYPQVSQSDTYYGWNRPAYSNQTDGKSS